MKFHSVHGGNIVIDDGATRATRCNSFCDGIAFSHKPLAINSRLSLLLGGNDEWTGALRLGITTQDPSTLSNTKLPRYACPDLTSKAGFWARPLPENWASNGTRITFYVNSCGHLHLFVNSEHKGAILTGLPVKEQLWVLLDLYGVTVSAKFIATTGSAPIEVVARGPEAVLAYQNAVNDGSTSYHYTRLALIGPPNVGKSALKKILVKEADNLDSENNGIDASWVCQTSSVCKGEPWILIKPTPASSLNIEVPKNENNDETGDAVGSNVSEEIDDNGENTETAQVCDNTEEAYFQAIAFNVAHELLQQKKKKNEERRKTPLSRSAFKLHSSLSKISPVTKTVSKSEDTVPSKEKPNAISTNLDIPEDLPERVVQMVETMLKESENKHLWEKKDIDKYFNEKSLIRFNIWDYCGSPKCFLLHQMFLCSQTIYLLVFDLSKDLDSCASSSESNVLEFLGISNLSIMACLHMWLELIYVSVSYTSNTNETKQNDDQCDFHSLFPTVIIVGTRKEALSDVAQVDHQFNKLKESLQDMIYFKHILPKFFAISFENSEDSIQELRKKIEELTIQLSYVGIEIPLKWLMFEQAIDRLLERDVFFADINKLSEVARLENIESEEEFYSMIQFFHHKGKIWHFGSDLSGCNGIVILKPQWFINHIYQLLDLKDASKLKVPVSESEDADQNQKLTIPGVDINTDFFEKLWPTAYHQINVLLGILDIADIICEIPKSKASTEDPARLYFLPWLSTSKAYQVDYSLPNDKLDLVLEFSSSLPVCFLLRFFIRLYRSSRQFSSPRKGEESFNQGIMAIDYNHEIFLSRTSPNRIKVCLTQRINLDPQDEPTKLSPTVHCCTKVRYLLEKEAEHLQDRLYKRLRFSLCVPCPCNKVCEVHSKPACLDTKCSHLLNLNECLSKKVIECDFRVVKTDFVQKFFDRTLDDGSSYNTSSRLSEDFTFAVPSSVKSFWEDHDVIREEPVWLRVAGKMLTLSNTGRDWIALAKRLGYSEREITKFQSEIYPPMSLLSNWLESNGQTRYCIDLLVSCLEQMGRKDVVDRIHAELGPEPPSSPVFISYQSDAQELVLHLRRKLELAGYPCWMDVGNISCGDNLYGRIYEGISKSKVMLCCLTPHYALSPICSREVSLADVLRKPIIPVMLEPTPWPPPGPMALILSSLVYIDLCDIGGHGGCGRQADWDSRFQSIAERISHFISPSFLAMNVATTPSGRVAPPRDFAITVDNFLNTSGQTESDSPVEADTADEGDTSSVASSTREHANSPTIWEQTRHSNTVARCSICNLL